MLLPHSLRHKPYFRFSYLTESCHTASYVIKILNTTSKSLVEVVNEKEDFFHVCTCLSNTTETNGILSSFLKHTGTIESHIPDPYHFVLQHIRNLIFFKLTFNIPSTFISNTKIHLQIVPSLPMPCQMPVSRP